MNPPGVSRVAVTPAAAGLLAELYAAHGPLMFHQSGGCCDGSSPMCYLAGEFRTGASDVLLAALRIDEVPEPVTFWMSAAQFERWRHTHLTVDVVPGRGQRVLPRSTRRSPVPHPVPAAHRGGRPRPQRPAEQEPGDCGRSRPGHR